MEKMKITQHSELQGAVEALVAQDAHLAEIHATYGFPPLWKRPESFATLLTNILEQQVSLDSAKATFEKLRTVLGNVEPRTFLLLSDETLRACGFSRQKARYGRALAKAVADGSLDLSKLSTLEEDEIHKQLTAIVGIGQWTSDIYRLMAIGLPDIWPQGDIALAQALAEIHELTGRPDHETQLTLVERWRPYRSVAARLLWLKYLRDRNRAAVEFQ